MMEKRLLIVDDEENILHSLRRLFRREPYEILIAHSAQEGLDILNTEQISVILSDQRMPGMIGSEFFKIVKEKYPNTIRIIMSGYTELESITSAINDGAIYKFLLKPWDDEKLLNHIREAFSHQELKINNIILTDEVKKLNGILEENLKEEKLKNEFNYRTLVLAQQLLDKIPMAVFGVSIDGLIVMANQHAKLLTKREDIIGNQADAIFPENMCKAMFEDNQTTEQEIEWSEINRVAKVTLINNALSNCICVSILPQR
jgi:response regulator RpfG family c-di-GMP phosphodiesterase